MAATNREWVLTEYKGMDGLQLRDYVPQDAGPGEVRLKLEAFAFNWGDGIVRLFCVATFMRRWRRYATSWLVYSLQRAKASLRAWRYDVAERRWRLGRNRAAVWS